MSYWLKVAFTQANLAKSMFLIEGAKRICFTPCRKSRWTLCTAGNLALAASCRFSDSCKMCMFHTSLSRGIKCTQTHQKRDVFQHIFCYTLCCASYTEQQKQTQPYHNSKFSHCCASYCGHSGSERIFSHNWGVFLQSILQYFWIFLLKMTFNKVDEVIGAEGFGIFKCLFQDLLKMRHLRVIFHWKSVSLQWNA